MKVKIFNVTLLIFLLISTVVWYSNTIFGTTFQQNIRPILNLAAVIGMVFFFAQFLLSARIPLIEKGFGLDKMLYLHRYAGRVAVGALTVHGGLVFINQWLRLGRLSLSTYVLIGLIALVGMMITAGLASTYKYLKLRYEIWKNLHLFNYVIYPVAIVHVFNYSTPGSFLHYLWVFMTVGFVLIFMYRLQRIFSVRSSPYTITEVRQEGQDLWSLFFKGRPIDYKPGQFMILQLLRNGNLSAAHPFTISSSPDSEQLSVTIKELGDFTNKIGETKPGDQAMIDAPYGMFSLVNYPASNYIFIAGGIGITPFLSMLRYLKDKKRDEKITLFWGNKSEENLAFQPELASIMEDNPSLQIVLVMSEQPDWPGEKGFLTVDMMKKYHPFLADTRFFFCGPPPMTRAVLADLKKAEIDPERIHYEVFEL